MPSEIVFNRDEVLPKVSPSSSKWKWPETDDADSMDDSDDLSEEDDIFYDSEAVVEPLPVAMEQQPQQPIQDDE